MMPGSLIAVLQGEKWAGYGSEVDEKCQRPARACTDKKMQSEKFVICLSLDNFSDLKSSFYIVYNHLRPCNFH